MKDFILSSKKIFKHSVVSVNVNSNCKYSLLYSSVGLLWNIYDILRSWIIHWTVLGWISDTHLTSKCYITKYFTKFGVFYYNRLPNLKNPSTLNHLWQGRPNGRSWTILKSIMLKFIFRPRAWKLIMVVDVVDIFYLYNLYGSRSSKVKYIFSRSLLKNIWSPLIYGICYRHVLVLALLLL